jgi:hypothetical protein
MFKIIWNLFYFKLCQALCFLQFHGKNWILKMENSTLSNCTIIIKSPSCKNAFKDLSLRQYFFVFVNPAICPLTLLVNLFSFFIFSHAEFKHEELFIYLKLQALCICVDMVISMFTPMYTVFQWTTARSLLPRLIDSYGFYYLTNVVEKTELALTIMAAFSCYRMLNSLSTTRAVSVLRPYVISAFLIVLLVITTSHQIFYFDLVPYYDTTNNSTLYKRFQSSFSQTQTYKILDVLSFTLNNGLFLIILIVLDLAILKKLRESMNRKIKINTGNAEQLRRYKVKLTKTMIYDCSNSICCHFSIVLSFVLENSLSDGFPFIGPVWTLVYLTYINKFFIFFFFNKRFRLVVDRRFSKLKLFVKLR